MRKELAISCPVCGKHFQNQSGLTNHHRYKHPEARSLVATSAPGAPAHAANTGVQGPGKAKELVCAHCDKAFARPSSLATHIPPDWDELMDRRSRWVHVFGRLKEGVSAEQAQASLKPFYHQILEMEVREVASWC